MTHRTKLLRAALADALQTARKSTRRRVVRWRLDLRRADAEARIDAERRLRGREQYDQLRRADAVIVSYAKSGRTWLRVMISRLYQQVYDLPEDTLMGFDNFHHMDRRIPRLFFTHDVYPRFFTGNFEDKRDYHDKKVLMLVRDPRDVAVSQFFHWRHRTKDWKKDLNDYPPHGADISLQDFVRQERGGLPRIIAFLNLWAKESGRLRAFSLVRYEDMRADPVAVLTRVAQFLEIPADDAQLRDAVEYASYENMRRKETEQSYRMSGSRLAPGDKDNPDSYKVRRGKVGGYRDYFDDDQIAEIDAMVSDELDPIYGYGPSASHTEARA
jgi:alcohol sulfotransferase